MLMGGFRVNVLTATVWSGHKSELHFDQLDDDDGWSNGIFDDEGKVDFERKGVAFLACTIIMLNKPVVIPFSDLVCC